MTTIAGGIIDIEHTKDASATSPTWVLVGKTSGEISYSSNPNVAESDLHEKLPLSKAVTSEAWEVAFQKNIETTLGSLQTLGLVATDADGDSRMASFEESRDPNEQIRITVYDDAEAKKNGQVSWGLVIDEYVLVDSEGAIPSDGFATRSFTIHALQRPMYHPDLVAAGP